VNAGVSGYGAARELTRLRKLGLFERCAAIVIDYCDKDPRENRAFLDDPKGFIQKRNAADMWRGMQGYHQQDLSYLSILRLVGLDMADQYKAGGWGGLWSSIRTNNDPYGKRVDVGVAGDVMVDDFLKVLDHFPEARGKPIIVIELDDDGSHSDFMPSLLKVAARHPSILPLVVEHPRADFFRFDNHLSPTGHEAVARALDRKLADILRR
jgi:hypothetical protein